MSREHGVNRWLAWTGVLALLTVPVLLLLRKKPAGDAHQSYAEEGNVFESELEG